MIKWLYKRILAGLIVAGLILAGTEVVLKLVYKIAFRGNEFIVIASPFIGKTKYFVLLLAFLIFFKRHAKLTVDGERIVPLLMTFSVIGVIFTSFWITGLSEESIVRYRPWVVQKYVWEDVDEVTTEIKLRSFGKRKRRGWKAVVYRYELNMGDGKVVNVWGDVRSNYELDKYMKELGIGVLDKTDNSYNRVYNKVRFTSDDKLKKLESIFGITDISEGVR